MQPDKSTIVQLFDNREQYLIPLFQRGYVWTLTDEVLPLWDDIMDQVEALREFNDRVEKEGGKSSHLKPLKKHFLGTLVLGAPSDNGTDKITTREVIDGQQRITTFQLMFLALRDLVTLSGDAGLIEDLQQLTRNRGDYKDKTDHHKVRPTNVGRDILQSLVEQGGVEAVCKRFPSKANGKLVERPPLVQTYLFFYGVLSLFLRGKAHDVRIPIERDPEGQTLAHAIIRSIKRDPTLQIPYGHQPVDLAHARLLKKALHSCFQIMVLKLDDREDDPQIIFETLNARGVPLQPSDLVRNYLFLQSTRKGEDVDALYEEFWKPFDEQPDTTLGAKGEKFWKVEETQGRLKNSRLDLLLYHYLGLRRQETMKVSHVFEGFRDWWESEDRNTQIELQQLQNIAGYFSTFLAPTQGTRLGSFCRRMRLLDTSTLTPLVLYLLEQHDGANAAVEMALDDLESYVVRRFVCGFTPKGYNRIFLNRLLGEMVRDGSKDPGLLRKKLHDLDGISQRWPADPEFRQSWCFNALYTNRAPKVKAILEALEMALRSDKQEWQDLPMTLTVEHVLPQNGSPTDWPVDDPSDEGRATRQRLLHSIGNLTLVTPQFNSALSNAPFSEKRKEIVTTSLLNLNTYFQKFAEDPIWDESRIKTRSEELFELAKGIWPHPGPKAMAPTASASHGGIDGEDLDSTDTPWLPVKKAKKNGNGEQGPWNGQYYVAFGDEESRNWDEAIKYGFVSAGGGRWYSKTLSLLQPGGKVWVMMPGRGYVGVGIVEDPVVKVDAFMVTLADGRKVPITHPDAGIQSSGMFKHQGDPEKAEYLVRVKWIQTHSPSQAIWEPDFFAIQHSACRPKSLAWPRTIERLKEIWGIE
jgi:hypothetical protein